MREQSKIENNLHELNLRFQVICSSKNDAIIISDESKNILFWNKGASEIFGYNEHEVIGKPMTIIIPKNLHEKHNHGMERMNLGKEPRVIGKVVELTAIKKDETEFPIELTLGSWESNGKRHYSAIIRDITEKKENQRLLIREKERSDELLLNILPKLVADDLKQSGKYVPHDHDKVSVLFTDFIGFTTLSSHITASELVSELNEVFGEFDEIMNKYQIEKIKTIGDAYMAAGGLSGRTEDSVKRTVLAALDMQKFISNRKTEKDLVGDPSFEMRVGINTGPVVAGIVGVKKFQYDIWGDTVNVASRMESSGFAGRVNISPSTYDWIKDDPELIFESRGKINVKGKGLMEMWFVSVAK